MASPAVDGRVRAGHKRCPPPSMHTSHYTRHLTDSSVWGAPQIGPRGRARCVWGAPREAKSVSPRGAHTHVAGRCHAPPATHACMFTRGVVAVGMRVVAVGSQVLALPRSPRESLRRSRSPAINNRLWGRGSRWSSFAPPLPICAPTLPPWLPDSCVGPSR